MVRTGLLVHLSFSGEKLPSSRHISGSKKEIGKEQLKAEMFYEIEAFTTIIKKGDQSEYDTLKQLSYEVLSITESARKQNGIIFK